MKLYSVYDEEFRPYGQVLTGYDTAELLAAAETVPMPEAGTAYAPHIGALEACGIHGEFSARAYGGMPVELGLCRGYNTRLNCLEYHRGSELNIGTADFILLVARQEELREGRLDTALVRAFRAPAGAVVQLYETTLHYAPCQASLSQGFRVVIVLPEGTNEPIPLPAPCTEEDRWLTARNKWLLAHPDSPEAAGGAVTGLFGENIDITNILKENES